MPWLVSAFLVSPFPDGSLPRWREGVAGPMFYRGPCLSVHRVSDTLVWFWRLILLCWERKRVVQAEEKAEQRSEGKGLGEFQGCWVWSTGYTPSGGPAEGGWGLRVHSLNATLTSLHSVGLNQEGMRMLEGWDCNVGAPSTVAMTVSEVAKLRVT